MQPPGPVTICNSAAVLLEGCSSVQKTVQLDDRQNVLQRNSMLPEYVYLIQDHHARTLIANSPELDQCVSALLCSELSSSRLP
jgi:hypothetical protein